MKPGHPPRSRQVAFWIAGCLALSFLYFFPRAFDWNPHSHLDTTLALVNNGTMAIDPYHWNTGDLDYNDGHFYSNKAPGLSLIGVPIYAAHRAILQLSGQGQEIGRIGLLQFWNQDSLYFRGLEYIETIYTVAIPAVLALLLFFWFLGTYDLPLADRVLVTLALGWATPLFPYAQVFYSHVPAAALLFAAFVVAHLVRRKPDRESSWSAWLLQHPPVAALLIGFALAGAVSLEYDAVIAAVPVGLYSLRCLPFRLWPALAAGTIPVLAVLIACNVATYHNPLTTGYGSHSLFFASYESQGIAGFTWPPRPNALWGMSFSPYRGLLFVSPWLLLAFPGALLWARVERLEALTCMGTALLFFVAIAMYGGWTGGNSVGPRYLIPIIPFLAAPAAFALVRLRRSRVRWGIWLLMAISTAIIWIESIGGAINAYPPMGLENPLMSYSWPALLHGSISASMGTLLLAPLGLGSSPLTLAPLVMALLVWSWILLRPLRRRDEIGTTERGHGTASTPSM